MKNDVQRKKLLKLQQKLLELQKVFHYNGIDIVRSVDECVDKDGVYLIVNYNEKEK